MSTPPKSVKHHFSRLNKCPARYYRFVLGDRTRTVSLGLETQVQRSSPPVTSYESQQQIGIPWAIQSPINSHATRNSYPLQLLSLHRQRQASCGTAHRNQMRQTAAASLYGVLWESVGVFNPPSQGPFVIPADAKFWRYEKGIFAWYIKQPLEIAVHPNACLHAHTSDR